MIQYVGSPFSLQTQATATNPFFNSVILDCVDPLHAGRIQRAGALSFIVLYAKALADRLVSFTVLLENIVGMRDALDLAKVRGCIGGRHLSKSS